MTGLFTFYKWKDYAIEIFCSNEHCKSEIIIDSRQIQGLVFCSEKCTQSWLKNCDDIRVNQ